MKLMVFIMTALCFTCDLAGQDLAPVDVVE